MELGPITYLEINGEDVTDYIRTPEPWTLDHRLHVLIQSEARPGQPNDKGERWIERRLTGKGIAFCSCGYTTSLVEKSTLPDAADLAVEHPRARGGDMPVSMLGPYGPVDAVADWLRANDVEPSDVPIAGPITIERESTDGPWCIRYAALLRRDGQLYVDEATGSPAQELRTVPLIMEPRENVQVRWI